MSAPLLSADGGNAGWNVKWPPWASSTRRGTPKVLQMSAIEETSLRDETRFEDNMHSVKPAKLELFIRTARGL